MKTDRTVVGVNTAKRVFQLHWFDIETGESVDVKLTREKFLDHFANRTPCVVVMEACEDTQHWARQLRELGHDPWLLPTKAVRLSAIASKDDARALCTAAQKPGIKQVAIKSGPKKNRAPGFGSWLYKLWQRRVASVQHHLGLLNLLDEDTWSDRKAVELFRKALANGNAAAYAKLGWMYEHGRGMSQDFDEAHHCYEEAFHHGDIMGVYCLADMYANGETAPKNDEETTKWLRIAARHKKLRKTMKRFGQRARKGYVFYQNLLGLIYASGQAGVPEDFEQAYAWFSIAAAQGYPPAEKHKQRLAEAMSRAEIASAQKLARESSGSQSLSAKRGRRGLVRWVFGGIFRLLFGRLR